jgi:hypothetical protein
MKLGRYRNGVVTFLSIAVLVSCFFWFKKNLKSNMTSDAPVALVSGDSGVVPSKGTTAAVTSLAPTSSTSSSNADVPTNALPFDAADPYSPKRDKETWFLTHSGGAKLEFPEVKLPIVWAEGCASEKAWLGSKGLGSDLSNLTKRLGFEGTKRYPEGVLVESLTQFWTRESRYFQLAAEWNENEPPSYKISGFSSASADMGDEAMPFEFEGAKNGAPLSIESVYSLTETLLKKAEALGGARGARIVLLSSTSNALNGNGKKIQPRVEFIDANARGFSAGNVLCNLDRAKFQSRCECGPETMQK